MVNCKKKKKNFSFDIFLIIWILPIKFDHGNLKKKKRGGDLFKFTAIYYFICEKKNYIL